MALRKPKKKKFPLFSFRCGSATAESIARATIAQKEKSKGGLAAHHH